MLFAGISLTSAFSKKPRPIEIAVLDDELGCCRLVQSTWCEPNRLIAREPEVIWDVLTAEIPESDSEEVVWAIDGPQGLASQGMKLRHCERDLRTPGRTPDHLPSAISQYPFHGYIRSSLDLFSAVLSSERPPRLAGMRGVGLEDANLFEIFPGSEWSVLAGRPLVKKDKNEGRRQRRLLLEHLGIQGLPDLPTHDENDALVGV